MMMKANQNRKKPFILGFEPLNRPMVQNEYRWMSAIRIMYIGSNDVIIWSRFKISKNRFGYESFVTAQIEKPMIIKIIMIIKRIININLCTGKSIVNGNLRNLKLGAYGPKLSLNTMATIKCSTPRLIGNQGYLELSFFPSNLLHHIEPMIGSMRRTTSTFHHPQFTQENNETIIIKRTVYIRVECIHSHSVNNIRPRKYLHIRLVKTIEERGRKKRRRKNERKEEKEIKSHRDISHLNGSDRSHRLFIFGFSLYSRHLFFFFDILGHFGTNIKCCIIARFLAIIPRFWSREFVKMRTSRCENMLDYNEKCS